MDVSSLCRKYGFRIRKFEKFAEEHGKLNHSFGEDVINDKDVPELVKAYQAFVKEQEEEEAQAKQEAEAAAAVLHQVIKPTPDLATEATMKELLQTTQKIHFWIKFWSVLMLISIIIVILAYFGLAASISSYVRY